MKAKPILIIRVPFIDGDLMAKSHEKVKKECPDYNVVMIGSSAVKEPVFEVVNGEYSGRAREVIEGLIKGSDLPKINIRRETIGF